MSQGNRRIDHPRCRLDRSRSGRTDLGRDRQRRVDVTGIRLDHPRHESDDLSYRLPREATIEAAGAGVVVLVPYTCAAGTDGFFDAFLAQRADATTVQLSGTSLSLTCTATNRRVTLAFHAVGTAWKSGGAFLVVSAISCGATGCTQPAAFRTIRLV